MNRVLFRLQPGWIAGLTIVAAPPDIGLNLLLVPRFGIMAAAVNTLIAFTVLFGLAYMAGQRDLSVRYEGVNLLRSVLRRQL